MTFYPYSEISAREVNSESVMEWLGVRLEDSEFPNLALHEGNDFEIIDGEWYRSHHISTYSGVNKCWGFDRKPLFVDEKTVGVFWISVNVAADVRCLPFEGFESDSLMISIDGEFFPVGVNKN